MGKKLPHTMVLVALALIACAFISGYNAFYVPQTNLPRIIYTEKGTRPEGTAPSAPPQGAPFSTVQAPTRADAALKVNINTAGAQELQERLDGVGEVIAARIVAYREEHGPFGSIEEIRNVRGIGEATFENIKNDITV